MGCSCKYIQQINRHAFEFSTLTFLVGQQIGTAIKEVLEDADELVDNLPAHKPARVREAIEGSGTTLALLPAYSPDRASIENVFAQLKTLLRAKA